jgi:heme/copper-type cytochrome/quinol oxidase subunit 1
MEPFVRRFIRSSLLWLALGVVLGTLMAFIPFRAMAFRPAHVHANLLGFVSMMIYGVAYHVIPRFGGRPLFSRAAARAHLWIANLGLAGLVGGWLVVPWHAGGLLAVRAGALLAAVGALLFVVNLWKTLDPPPAVLGIGAAPRRDAVPAGR